MFRGLSEQWRCLLGVRRCIDESVLHLEARLHLFLKTSFFDMRCEIRTDCLKVEKICMRMRWRKVCCELCRRTKNVGDGTRPNRLERLPLHRGRVQEGEVLKDGVDSAFEY